MNVQRVQVGGVPLTSLLVADDQEKLPTGQCRPRVPPSPINLRGDAYLGLQKTMSDAQVSMDGGGWLCCASGGSLGV